MSSPGEGCEGRGKRGRARQGRKREIKGSGPKIKRDRCREISGQAEAKAFRKETISQGLS